MESLFPGLPDEIGLECLLRVELNSHHNLKCVCKSWNAALKNPHFYQERKRLTISEQRICMLDHKGIVVYDLAEKSCRRLLPIPAQIGDSYRCHFAKQKLVLISDRSNCVWLYDFTCSKWWQGAEMPSWPIRCFASATDEHRGLIYVAGGKDKFANWVRSASVYNVEEDKWDFLPDMNTYMEYCDGVFSDGKFYVYSGPRIQPTFEVYDSYTRSWISVENRFNSVCFLSAFERLYCLSGRELIEYDYSQDKFHIVGPHSMEWWEPLLFAAEFGHNIFVGSMDYDSDQTFFTLTPPSETGEAFKRIGIEIPSSLRNSFFIRAATLDL